jgi:DNA replication and repair protein RecF
MSFQSAQFNFFRNLQSRRISLDAREIFLVGPNGQGKTNFLEGIYWLCYASSFRTKQEKKIPKMGEKDFSVLAQFSSLGEEFSLKVQWKDGRKGVFLNGLPLKDRKELIQYLPCIAFTHEDFLFVNGAPAHQRQFFDQTLSLFDGEYIDDLRNLKKLVRMRNKLLIQEDRIGLDVFDQQLIAAGMRIQEKRQQAITEFQPIFQGITESILGLDGLELRYSPSWKPTNREELISFLLEKRNIDFQTKRSNYGPHRDRYGFFYQGKNFIDIASTGQVRLLSLVLRVAQGMYFTKKTGQKPILLLDDVLLELDPQKQEKFIQALPEYKQAFFTFLPESRYDRFLGNQSIVYAVNEGSIEPYAGTAEDR